MSKFRNDPRNPRSKPKQIPRQNQGKNQRNKSIHMVCRKGSTPLNDGWTTYGALAKGEGTPDPAKCDESVPFGAGTGSRTSHDYVGPLVKLSASTCVLATHTWQGGRLCGGEHPLVPTPDPSATKLRVKLLGPNRISGCGRCGCKSSKQVQTKPKLHQPNSKPKGANQTKKINPTK